MGQARVWYSVMCRKHGIESTQRRDIGRMVVVSAPKNKTIRKFAGCPICSQLARAEKRRQNRA